MTAKRAKRPSTRSRTGTEGKATKPSKAPEVPNFYSDSPAPGWIHVEIDLRSENSTEPFLATGLAAEMIAFRWACHIVLTQVTHLGWSDAADAVQEIIDDFEMPMVTDRAMN